MKNKLFNFPGLVILAIILPVVAMLLVYPIYSQSNEGIEITYKNSKKIIEGHKEDYRYIFTVLFDKARNCNGNLDCQKQVSDAIHQRLNPYEKETPFYSATYFIRIKDDGIYEPTIEKLFLRGELVDELINTNGEWKVFQFLENNNTGYLKGIRIDQTYSTMNYLVDFPAEAEIIIPFKTDTTGAVVKLYGD